MDTGYYRTVATPDGPFTLVANQNAVVASGWTGDIGFFVAKLHLPSSVTLVEDEQGRRSPVLALAGEAVDAYYQGDGAPARDIPLNQDCGVFHHQVRQALASVGYGHRITYHGLAELAGNPSASRAAASACARNNTALFLPCHRVIRSDGSLGGFLYGLDLKQRLLDRESAYEG